MRIGHDQEFNFALVLEGAQPLALLVEDVGGDFDRDLHDDARGAVLAQLLADEAQDRERHRLDAADAADADATRAHDVARLAERRPQTLARHLQQSEARQPADLDAGAIHLHGVAQPIFDIALVLGRLHVDEVDDDQATDVTDAQLARDFIRRFEIGVGGGGLDIAPRVARAELMSIETSASV